MAYRDVGFMSELNEQSIPRNFLFYDTETFINQVSPKTNALPLRLGVAIYIEVDNEYRGMKRKVYRFRTADEFIEIIKEHNRAKTRLHVIAHNQGFDIRVLNLPHLFTENGWAHDLPIINNRSFIWNIHLEKSTLCLLDTANFGVMSVEQLGKDMNLPKLDVDFNSEDDESLFIYCQRDCEVLEKFMLEYLRFIGTNQLGKFRSTLASQALSTYRTSFLKTPPYIHDFWFAHDLEREAYHGGRTEAFYIGKLPPEDYYYLDVNSMYPHVMTYENLPQRIEGFTKDVSPRLMKLRLRKWYVIADVTYTTDKPFSSIITNHKLMFPTGRLRAVLHSPELEYLLDNGTIHEVHRCAVYSKAPVFRDYVTFFNGVKEQASIDGNTSWRYIAKLFGNSLYGKMGQLRPRRELLDEIEYDGIWRMTNIDAKTHQEYSEICWYGKIYREYKKGETPFSFAGLAGAVTAHARMLLWSYIEKAHKENVYYCDTDSLIVNRNGYINLADSINPHKLGMLKLEKQSSHVVIHGCKDYEFDTTKRKKGVPAKATQLQEGLWEYDQFEGFLTWMNKGATGVPIVTRRNKQRRSKYDKGVIGADNVVTPHKFTMVG